jgi:membrane protease subunit (stomatin/prohibitin family)
VRLRAFGTYAMRVTDPGALLKQLSGTDGLFQVEEVQNQLRNQIVGASSQLLGTGKIAALDLMGRSAELNKEIEKAINTSLTEWGIQLTRFVLENVSFPPEVEKALDQRTKMGVVGDLQRFTQYQTAEAIPEAAKNPGGGAGVGMGLGAGISLGQQMASSMGGALGAPGAAGGAGGAMGDVKTKLEQLKALFDQKLINEAEYEAKRKELLSRL